MFSITCSMISMMEASSELVLLSTSVFFGWLVMSLCCSALGREQPCGKTLALHTRKELPAACTMPAAPEPETATAALFESYGLFGAEPGVWLSSEPSDEADAAPELRKEVDAAALQELFESYGIFGGRSASERHVEVAKRHSKTPHDAAEASVQVQELFESYGVFGASWTSEPQQAADVEAAQVPQTLLEHPVLGEAAALAFVKEKDDSDAASTACASELDISDLDSDFAKGDC